MKKSKKIVLFILCCFIVFLSGYLYIDFIDNDSLYESNDVVQYRYDTNNGYVGLDITLNSLVANSDDSKVIAENTKKLQDAINKVSDAGGGYVYLPSGTFYFARGGMNSSSEQEDFVIKCRNNVHLKGAGTNENSSSYTVLKPVYNSPSANGGLDMFYFNNYKDTGYGQGITTSTVRNVSHVDASGNTVTWNNQTVYLINADFSDFVIDGDSARGGIANKGGTYRTDGKGFMINLFSDCDWNNVVVKNVDATGFGVDCPINSTIVNCKAINCGKAATKADGGASGFGIGTGYSNNESLVIDNCIAINNKKFGFFFEHQARFSNTNYKAVVSKGFVVMNSIAGGNMYDFGGLKAYDVSYENNKSVSNYSTYSVSGLKATNTSNSDGYTPLTFSGGKVKLNTVTQPIFFSTYSTNSMAIYTNVFDMLTDVSTYKTEVRWAVNNGVIPVNSATKFGVSSPITRFDVVKSLFAFRGYPGSVAARKTTDDRQAAKTAVANIGFTDLGGSQYQDDLDVILWAYNAGIISKSSAFNPATNCTRADVATMLYRLAGKPSVSGSMPFTDVKVGSWYYDAVLWGYNTGIIKGISDTSFAPTSTITKQQLAIFLYRLKTNGSMSFNIKYNLDGGNASNITTYNASTSYTLKNPTRSGYTFVGWTGSNGTTPSKSVTIPAGTTGNLSYTAKWSANLTNIFIKNKPTKTVYKVGDTLDTNGLVVGAKYGDNNIKDISGYTVSPKTLTNSGTQTITINYNGLTTSYNVTVNRVDVSKISISSKPKKLSYYVGDTLDTNGLVLKVSYNDGTVQSISNGFTVTPTKLDKKGIQKITVKYGNKSASFDVNVNDVVVSSISIKSNPIKTEYYIGEFLDTKGLVLSVKYNNGKVEDVTSGYSVNVSELKDVGKQKVEVTYKKKTVTFTINVKDITIKSIKVKELPDKTNYFVGDTFSSKGLKIVTVMSNFYEEEITNGYSLSIDEGVKLSNVGVITVTIKYKDFSTSYNIVVANKVPETLFIAQNPNDTVYAVGEKFNSDGLVVKYINSTGKTTEVKNYTLSIENGSILSTSGTHGVEVRYNNKVVKFSIVVMEVSKLYVNDTDIKTTYRVGESFETDKLKVIAEYKNGTKEKLEDQYKVVVEDGNGSVFTTSGNKVVTISYGDAKTSITVLVEDSYIRPVNKTVVIIIIVIFVIEFLVFIKSKKKKKIDKFMKFTNM